MSPKIRSLSGLRRRVEELQCPVPERLWQIAVDERAATEALHGENTPEWLADKLRRWMEFPGAPTESTPRFLQPERRQKRKRGSSARQQAISEALATVARQSEDVQGFRRTLLNNQLLPFEEVEQWIEKRRRQEVYPHALLVRLKAGFKLDWIDGWQLDPPLSSLGNEQIEGLAPGDALDHAKPGGRYVSRVPIGREGTLRVLFQLSSSLARQFLWQQAQATMFVLTDITPLVSTEKVEVGWGPATRMPSGELLPLSCLARVTLTVDPVMTPRELCEKYAKLRAKLLRRKPRVQSEKHLQLAVFATEQPVLNANAMKDWNRKFLGWKYPRVSLFAWNARKAKHRLLHYRTVDPWKAFADEAPPRPSRT